MNPTRRVFFRSSFLVIWAVAMTTVTVVLGAPPLRILRLVMGRLLFFAIALGLSLVLFGVGWKPLAILFLLLTALVGVYSELLDRKWHPISSAAIAVSLSCIFGILGFGLWTLRVGKSWYAQALEYLKATLGGLSFFKTEMGFAVEDLLMQAPSGLVVLLLLASAVLLIMEPRLREWAGTSGREMNTSYLRGFRLPDVFVWVTILSLLGSFVKSDIKWIQVVSVNLLNVCVLLYFFQGLAVFTVLFDRLKITPFWRILWTTLLVFQLFIVVSIVGLMDYWMDFRQRFEKRTKQLNKTL